MGRHVYLNGDNAEDVLEDCLIFMQSKVRREAREKAFEDCTAYWTKEVEDILKDNCPNGAKLSRIRQLFNIKPID